MITEPPKISLGEHLVQTMTFSSMLLVTLPEIKKTVHNIMEIKKKRKLSFSDPKPQEQTDCDSSVTEQSF